MEFIAESSTLEFIAESSTSELRLMGESDSPFSDSLLSDACELSCSVYSSGRDDLSYLKVEKENTVIFAFCGSLDPHVFGYTTTQFGECQINNVGCLEWMKDGNNQLASVHQGALTQFLHIWNSSRVQEEARLEYERGKTVVFTGHSMGGAIASLATLWMLDKQLQPGKPKSVFCITFGFPLIGDEILSRAVRRKGWADQFCHVVLGRDIFSRVLLAPSISVCKPLETLFPYWKRSMQSVRCFMDSTDTAMEEALPLNVDGMTEFVGTVVQNCSAVVNYSSAVNMSPNNPFIAAVKALVKLSPYKPFGHYVFCSRSGGIRIENHFAILPILFYTLQTSDANLEEFILEHVGYGNILPNALQSIVKLNELSDLPLSEAGSIYQDRRITTQLDAFGLGIQNGPASLSLRAAGQVLKQQGENVSRLENEIREKIEVAIKEIEEYRLQCFRNGIGYYDSFKKKQHRTDFDANLNRLKLAGWWDEIIQMIDKDELPEDFQCSEVWIRLGSHYRLLVEPLDIANFYRLGKNEDSGPYLGNGRPRRYKTLQKWLEDNEVNNQLQPAPTGFDQPTMLTQDSCLWAYVEEISCFMRSNNVRDLEKTAAELEGRVRRLINSNGLSMEELVAGKSTFNTVVSWLWTRMPPLQKASSPLSSIIDRHPELIN